MGPEKTGGIEKEAMKGMKRAFLFRLKKEDGEWTYKESQPQNLSLSDAQKKTG